LGTSEIENFVTTIFCGLSQQFPKSQKFLTRDCPSCSYYTKDFPVSQTYDRAGNVKTITYPSGRVVNYSYNQASQLTSFTGKLGGLTGAGGVDVTRGGDDL
jgi:YD repeat-containing protein